MVFSLESSQCGALLEASRCHDKDNVVDGVVVQDKDDIVFDVVGALLEASL